MRAVRVCGAGRPHTPLDSTVAVEVHIAYTGACTATSNVPIDPHATTTGYAATFEPMAKVSRTALVDAVRMAFGTRTPDMESRTVMRRDGVSWSVHAYVGLLSQADAVSATVTITAPRSFNRARPIVVIIANLRHSGEVSVAERWVMGDGRLDSTVSRGGKLP
jgi:hypothetical protein